MTIREINELRKSGKLQEALEVAEHEFSLNQNNYTASALFWCLYDISKQESEPNSLSSLYKRMKSLHEDYCSSEEYMPKSLTSIERRIDPISKEIKDALEKAKNNSLTTEVIQKCHKLFEDKALNKIYYPDFGWLIYYNLKYTPLNEASKRKQLLHSYLQLELPRPNLLHSLILGEAVKIEKNTPLKFRIRDFMLIWGWENIRPEDWEQFQSENGNIVASLVEKLISVYAKELETDIVSSPDEFNTLIDRALIRFPNNQNMPKYKAMALISLGMRDEALKYYKQLILKSPSKCYLWNQTSAVVEDLDLKIALLCKAISVERDESFLGGCRLNLAKALIAKGLFSNAKYEIDKYRDFYLSQSWSLKQEYHAVASMLPSDILSEENSSLYNEYLPTAEDFIYGAIPSQFAIKIEDKMLEDRNRPGRKFIQWTLRTKDETIRIRKPSKFGVDGRMNNGSTFDIKIHDGKVVWIKKSNSNPLEQNWIKKAEGLIRIRTDRNGKSYALLDGAYIGSKLLFDINDGESARIVAIQQEDNRWSAIELTKI